MSWLIILLLANIVALTLLGLIVWRLHSNLRQLSKSTSELAACEHNLPPEFNEGGPRMIITLEILNPLSLVAERSWIGGKFSALTPGLMRRIVLSQTRDQLRSGMKENGVEADVRLVRLS